MLFVWLLILISLARAQEKNEGESESRLILSAEPNPIEGGLTKNLLLNCSFEGTRKDRIISMTISKQNGPDGFQDGGELAGITTFGNAVSKAARAIEATVSGDVRKKSSGYLSLALEKVSEKTQGVYFCRAIIFQEPTGTSDLTSRVKVGYKSPHISGLLKRLDMLESKVLDEVGSLKVKIEGLEHKQSWMRKFIIGNKYWVSEPWNGRRFYLSYDHWASPDASNKACRAIGGYLAEIDTKEEYDYVKRFIHTYPHSIVGVILGGTDEAKEGDWRNRHSGTPVGYLNWSGGQPDNSGREHCLEYRLPFKAMNDLPCTSWPSHRYLCEVPLKVPNFN